MARRTRQLEMTFFLQISSKLPQFFRITRRLAQVRLLHRPIYTASKNYMQLGFFVILYRFLNQCFRNLAPDIVTFVPAYMQSFMLISGTINKW